MADQTTTPIASPCGAPSAPSGGQSSGTGADGAQGAPQASMTSLLTPVLIFVLIFYFFIMRPQRKKQKQQDSLLNSITRGDQIVTIGGFLGTVREVRDDTLTIELAEGVKVRILKTAVQTKRAVAPAAVEEKKD